MEGYLKKWTNIWTRWKKRYFIFENTYLLFSENKGTKELGRVYISTTNISLTDKSIIVLETGIATLQLKASSEKETKQWYTAIKNCKDSLEVQATEYEYTRNRFDSYVDLPENQSYIQKLHQIYNKLQEEFENFPDDFKEKLMEFMDHANEFRNLALDSLNALGDGKKDDFLQTDEFEDARSQATVFEDARTGDIQLAYRYRLPAAKNPNHRVNIWKILKDTIGKDLSRMAVPVYFNEPLSFLQRFTEDLTYSSIILKAVKETDPYLRIAYIACFAVSGYIGSDQRLHKPFNPLLGETFELEKDGFRVISEQVSHHPPISAIHCEHPEFVFYAHSQIKTSFKGTYLQIKPDGKFHLHLHQTKEHFAWEKPYTNVNNIVVGKVNVDHHGTMVIENIDTNYSVTVLFKKRGWFSKETNQVICSILDQEGREKYLITGKWNESLSILNKLSGEELVGYQASRHLPAYEFNYHFSEFALQLNLHPDVVPGIAPTDSRRRPDQRALENGDIELASKEKYRLEEKQRTARKTREIERTEWKPVWFEVDHYGDWVYKGGYWKAKNYQDFGDCPDIY